METKNQGFLFIGSVSSSVGHWLRSTGHFKGTPVMGSDWIWQYKA